jgi:hypothetical protein
MNNNLARGVRPLCDSTLTAVARLDGMAELAAREDVRNSEEGDCAAVTAFGAGTVCVDGWASSLPSTVRVIVTKVRTGDKTEELVVVEDSVDNTLDVTDVGGMEKESSEDTAAVVMLVLVVDEGIDDRVGVTAELELLSIVKEEAAASAVGFG